MPKQEFFPDELQELSLKNALEFSFSYFEEYLNKLIEKGYIKRETLRGEGKIKGVKYTIIN